MTDDSKESALILWFEQIRTTDVHLVGGKNASLGEMIQNLGSKGIKVPRGFALTVNAYKLFLEKTGVGAFLEETLTGVNVADLATLQSKAKSIRNEIVNCKMPEEISDPLHRAYAELCRRNDTLDLSVAVRSSATSEDLADASFAGQQDSYLNVTGYQAVVEDCKRCYASLFNDRAISYRFDRGFSLLDVYLSVGIQKMVRSDSATSGVIFTLDTESGFRDVILITGGYGLGENMVQGAIIPDEYLVYKPLLKYGFRPIIGKTIGTKKTKIILGDDGEEPTKSISVPSSDRERFILTDDEVLKLARWSMIIEDHYEKPMDIEWAKDGDGRFVGSGEMFIVQARPETVHSQDQEASLLEYLLKEEGPVLLEGNAVGSKIGAGKVKVIQNASGIKDFQKGEVLVTDMTDPDWEPVMKIASAIVTNRGGRTCHAAIVSRELGIPCVVGTGNGTQLLRTKEEVTVSCAGGEKGYVYSGLLKWEVKKTEISNLPKTKTKIMMNVGIPEMAFKQRFIPNDGVGLARVEFIINSYIGVHPLALIHFDELEELAATDKKLDEALRSIKLKTMAFGDKTDFFIENLAIGIGKIAAAFYPKDMIVRLSDFKSNEYRELIGGYRYEPQESNPMLGWRGASRYYDARFRPAFDLECRAIQRARNLLGFRNIKIMVPFCRTPDEGVRVLAILREHGLEQGRDGFEVYMMAEVPSNVILAEQFADIFDGFSIGSNDLTQLTLGLDRDSEQVAHLYDERMPAVKWMIAKLIATAKEKGKKVGICGQAPSDFPEFAEFLVECGIDSMSLNPDSVIKTKTRIAAAEKAVAEKAAKAKAKQSA